MKIIKRTKPIPRDRDTNKHITKKITKINQNLSSLDDIISSFVFNNNEGDDSHGRMVRK